MTVIRLPGTGVFDSNIYIVSRGSDAVIVDAGTGISPKGLVRSIKDHMSELELKALLLTHEHFDHSGGARVVSESFSIPVLASPECCRVLRTGDEVMSGAGLFGHDLEPLKEVSEVGNNLKLGELEFDVHHVPGHCRGQVSFVERAEKALFCGDLAFCDGGVGRWDLPGGDLEALKRSLAAARGWDVLSMHPGHGREELQDPGKELELAFISIADL